MKYYLQKRIRRREKVHVKIITTFAADVEG